MWAVAGIVVACATVNTGCSQGATSAPARVKPEAVDAIAARILREQRLPSLSIAVASGTQVLLSKAYGKADLEDEVAAGPRTVYRIGSITKQFSAAAILRLVERHLVSLDDPIARYVPALRDRFGEVTVRHLLNHTSGIRSFTSLPGFAAKKRLDLSDDELIDVFRNEDPDFAAGSNFLYNNSGYYLLAMIIERVSGQPYADFVREELFVPLNLEDTFACDDRRLIPRRARGYTISAGTIENASFISLAPPKGGGNLCSTATDLARWAQALAAGRVIRAQSYRLMVEPGEMRDGRRIGYGLGLFLANFNGQPEVSHGGAINGFSSHLGVFPASDLIVVTMTNAGWAALYDGHLTREIVGAISGGPAERTPNGSVDVADVGRFTGTYGLGSAVITLQRSGDRLVVERTTADHLWERESVYKGEGAFAALENPELGLKFSPTDRTSTHLSITLSGRAFGDAERAEPAEPSIK